MADNEEKRENWQNRLKRVSREFKSNEDKVSTDDFIFFLRHKAQGRKAYGEGNTCMRFSNLFSDMYRKISTEPYWYIFYNNAIRIEDPVSGNRVKLGKYLSHGMRLAYPVVCELGFGERLERATKTENEYKNTSYEKALQSLGCDENDFGCGFGKVCDNMLERIETVRNELDELVEHMEGSNAQTIGFLKWDNVKNMGNMNEMGKYILEGKYRETFSYAIKYLEDFYKDFSRFRDNILRDYENGRLSGGKRTTRKRTTRKKTAKKFVRKTVRKIVRKPVVKKSIRCSAKTASGKRCLHKTTKGKRCGHHRR